MELTSYHALLLLYIHRWIENIQEFRPEDPLHDLKHLKGYPNHQKSVFGKISDDHGATYDFKVYEGETDAAGRAHGEGRWVWPVAKIEKVTYYYANFRIIFRNGDTFIGNMMEGKRHGQGLLKYGDHSKLRL